MDLIEAVTSLQRRMDRIEQHLGIEPLTPEPPAPVGGRVPRCDYTPLSPVDDLQRRIDALEQEADRWGEKIRIHQAGEDPEFPPSCNATPAYYQAYRACQQNIESLKAQQQRHSGQARPLAHHHR